MADGVLGTEADEGQGREGIDRRTLLTRAAAGAAIAWTAPVVLSGPAAAQTGSPGVVDPPPPPVCPHCDGANALADGDAETDPIGDAWTVNGIAHDAQGATIAGVTLPVLVAGGSQLFAPQTDGSPSTMVQQVDLRGCAGSTIDLSAALYWNFDAGAGVEPVVEALVYDADDNEIVLGTPLVAVLVTGVDPGGTWSIKTASEVVPAGAAYLQLTVTLWLATELEPPDDVYVTAADNIELTIACPD
jgi:hypothetical protein